MPILINYWKHIAIAVAIIISFGYGYYKGHANEKEKFDAFKLQTQTNAKIQQDKNEALVKKQVQVSENITKEYANAVKKLNAYYAANPKRVYINTASSRVSENSTPTKAVDGEAKGNLPDTARDATLDCASDVLQLLYLQEWIETQLLIE